MIVNGNCTMAESLFVIDSTFLLETSHNPFATLQTTDRLGRQQPGRTELAKRG